MSAQRSDKYYVAFIASAASRFAIEHGQRASRDQLYKFLRTLPFWVDIRDLGPAIEKAGCSVR
jgi:hypothetical protein